jgi:hypothetical protein
MLAPPGILVEVAIASAAGPPILRAPARAIRDVFDFWITAAVEMASLLRDTVTRFMRLIVAAMGVQFALTAGRHFFSEPLK